MSFLHAYHPQPHVIFNNNYTNNHCTGNFHCPFCLSVSHFPNTYGIAQTCAQHLPRTQKQYTLPYFTYFFHNINSFLAVLATLYHPIVLWATKLWELLQLTLLWNPTSLICHFLLANPRKKLHLHIFWAVCCFRHPCNSVSYFPLPCERVLFSLCHMSHISRPTVCIVAAYLLYSLAIWTSTCFLRLSVMLFRIKRGHSGYVFLLYRCNR